MNEGRYWHACTSFILKGEKVLIVTGGLEKQVGSKGLDSTEIYKNKVWKTVAGKLNDAQFWGPKATNVNNKVLLFGGNNGDGNPTNKILEYNPETEEWTEIGTMRVATGDHGLSLVGFKDYEEMCMT